MYIYIHIYRTLFFYMCVTNMYIYIMHIYIYIRMCLYNPSLSPLSPCLDLAPSITALFLSVRSLIYQGLPPFSPYLTFFLPSFLSSTRLFFLLSYIVHMLISIFCHVLPPSLPQSPFATIIPSSPSTILLTFFPAFASTSFHP